MGKEEYFIPENEVTEEVKEFFSPSGNYRLTVTPFKTKPGSWNYSQGKFYKVGSDVPIAVVNRNYGRFPFTFIEEHEKGPLAVCGEDYQGLTVVELKTGLRKDSLNRDADKGFGFCSADFVFNAENQVLLICGCFWGGPYEYRVVDFSDPIAKGWETIESERYYEEDPRKPVFLGDTITFFSTPYPTQAQEDEWEKEHGEESDFDRTTLPLAASWKVRIEGKKLVVVETYMTDEEKARRKRDEEED